MNSIRLAKSSQFLYVGGIPTRGNARKIGVRVEGGGKLSDRKGVSLPDSILPFSALTPKDRSDRDAALHAELFETAHLAGFALDARSMGLHHAVCHVIGGLTRIPHGINNAIVLPHAVRANARIAADAVAAVADALGIADLAAEAEAISVAYALPRTFRELGAPADLVERALPPRARRVRHRRHADDAASSATTVRSCARDGR